ncbi:hypothetical protein EIN_344810 [Entamoeba invadens IP1]|uniref:Uncharacterized protein n=1 Tax=Entamoeba invadens IP1 TaxID=370355 RepID=A0A0A1U388_ENTIV|nr:hypothetical protein EIN_344810 [Entamoeba invadens IP1]ELP88521.1 hypothetical protein EIN_344810 [Entamoeba invadens IP1]|eukprot:XP_004255292.1 hypothetical protein EIN_344810 [Entamoeba invadens IP1]
MKSGDVLKTMVLLPKLKNVRCHAFEAVLVLLKSEEQTLHFNLIFENADDFESAGILFDSRADIISLDIRGVVNDTFVNFLHEFLQNSNLKKCALSYAIFVSLIAKGTNVLDVVRCDWRLRGTMDQKMFSLICKTVMEATNTNFILEVDSMKQNLLDKLVTTLPKTRFITHSLNKQNAKYILTKTIFYDTFTYKLKEDKLSCLSSKIKNEIKNLYLPVYFD